MAENNLDVFIARQPIVNVRGSLFAYELFYRKRNTDAFADIQDDFQASTQVLINTICNMGTEWLLGNRQAFINVSERVLESRLMELMPADRVVLEVVPDTRITPELIEKMEAIRKEGYRFAVSVRDGSAVKARHVSDFFKIDVRELGVEKAIALGKALKNGFSGQMVAEKIEDRSMLNQMSSGGFDYFQGYYFSKPETFRGKAFPSSTAVILELLEKVKKHADSREIELGFKKDATLSFKLLKYINSVGFGLSCQVESIRHALNILGLNQLYRWLTLLLVTSGNDSTPPEGIRQAVIRGRLMELMAEKSISTEHKDSAFVVGVFSMLDVLLEIPMSQIVDQLSLPDDQESALLHRTGPYGSFLKIAEGCENGLSSELLDEVALLGISSSDLNRMQMEAMAWTDRLGI